MVVIQEILVGEKVVDQRSVVTVHGCAKKSDETGNVELECCSSEWLRGLFEHCFVESLIPLNDLDVDFGMFLDAID